MKFDPDDRRDEEVDPVLERLVGALPAERAFAGDDGIVARSAAAAIARRVARASGSKLDAPSSAPLRRAWSWVALAAASAVLVGVAVTELVVPPAPPVPAQPTTQPVDVPPAQPLRHTSAPEMPSKDDGIPALDVSALPSVALPKATAPAALPSTHASVQPSTTRTAAEMFAFANDARRRRDSSAPDLYRELQSTYPSSAEAVISFVTLGRLELDRGHASLALAQFERYLETNTTELREDALAGRASALENLGRRADELRAWEALLSEYPRTLLATHAKERLAVLR
ncbi:MAG: hypothetical protein K0S65_2857 [Labilithrix sp.]|nr:hypothetical protein [Labilithrix sp.]